MYKEFTSSQGWSLEGLIVAGPGSFDPTESVSFLTSALAHDLFQITKKPLADCYGFDSKRIKLGPRSNE